MRKRDVKIISQGTKPAFRCESNFGEAGSFFVKLCNLNRIVGEAKNDGSRAKYSTSK